METTKLIKRGRSNVSGHTTPVKNPAEKKAKSGEEHIEVSNNAILEAIQRLESRVEAQLEDLTDQTRQSSMMLASLAKAVQFNAEELKECKKKVEELEKQMLSLEETTMR